MNKIERMLQELCPEGVEYKKLGDVCEIKGRIGFRGYTRKDLVTENEGAISLSPSNIENGCLHFDHCSYVSWAKYNESPEIMANIGDVVFTKTASVGKTALIKNLPKETTINPQLVLLKNITCNSAFLAYVLQDNRFQSEVQKITGVGSVPNVSQSALQGIEIPIPPLPVQEEIVRILDHFTELTASLQAELQARQEQYEYYRNKLLTFDEESVTWMKMSDLFDIGNGYTPSKANTEYWENGTIPWFRMEDIRQNGRILSDSIQHITPSAVKGGRLFPANSFIIATTATIGEHALIIVDSLANQQFTNLQVRKSLTDKIVVKFLYYYMFIVGKWCKNNTNVSGFASVDMSKFKKLLIPIPSIPEQQRIVDILDKFETLVNDLSQGLPAEIAAVQEQYEYYRNKLLTFNRSN